MEKSIKFMDTSKFNVSTLFYDLSYLYYRHTLMSIFLKGNKNLATSVKLLIHPIQSSW